MTEIEIYDQDNTLPVYEDTDWDRAVGEWDRASKAELVVQLYKGAIVTQIDGTYGEASRNEFAKATGENYSSLRDYASVYKRLQSLSEGDQSTILDMLRESHLTYTHVLRAAPIKDDETFVEILEQAHDQDKPVSWIAQERALRGVSGESIERAPEDTTEVIDAEPLVEVPYAVAVAHRESISGARESGHHGRYVVIDQTLDMEVSGPWESLIDTQTGEMIIDMDDVASGTAFDELVALANGETYGA